MFGYSAIPVINQKNAPAIWESNFVDFPANFISGRILIATDTGAIYLDLPASRIALQAGSMGTFEALNGLSKNTTSFSTEVVLGGSLVGGDTVIDINGNKLRFIGLTHEQQIDADGIISDAGTVADYMPILTSGVSVIVPNATLSILDLRTGDTYNVAAHKV
jgi:hypothetical protein